jgi:hypothetical protein
MVQNCDLIENSPAELGCIQFQAGGKIVGVGEAPLLQVPSGMRTIDCSGKTFPASNLLQHFGHTSRFVRHQSRALRNV